MQPIDVIRLEAAGRQRRDGDRHRRTEQELPRAPIAPQRVAPEPRVRPGGASHPMDLGAGDLAEPPGSDHRREERLDTRLSDRRAIEHHRHDPDAMAAGHQALHLAEDERLGDLRESRQDIRDPQTAAFTHGSVGGAASRRGGKVAHHEPLPSSTVGMVRARITRSSRSERRVQ